MTEFQSLSDEVKSLADAMFDGKIDSAGIQRLEALIVDDLACMQIYVERMTFHGEILKESREDSPAKSANTALKEFSQAMRLRERRQWLVYFGVYAAMASAVLLAVGTMLYQSGALSPAPSGMISNITADIRSKSGNIDLGQVVRSGETFSIEEGLVSLQFPHVMVDVLGPATVRIDGQKRVGLKSGTLLAKVSPGGEGFTVITSDAEVIDLGTEFLVRHLPGLGTDVSVRQGRARASLLDWRGNPTKVVEITDSRSCNFQVGGQIVKEKVYESELFEPIDRSRGGIQSIDGALRTATTPRVALFSGQVLTPTYLLIIPEKQDYVLPEALEINTVEGPLSLAAGTVVSSYLIHYDPTATVTTAPRGAVTFMGKIAGIVASSKDLKKTDLVLGLPGVRYEPASYREFELDEDRAQVSQDRRTASFYCGINPQEFLDEARVIVISQ